MTYNPNGQESFRIREVLTAIFHRSPKYYYAHSSINTLNEDNDHSPFKDEIERIVANIISIIDLVWDAIDPVGDYIVERNKIVDILQKSHLGIEDLKGDEWYDELTYFVELLEAFMLISECWLFDVDVAIENLRRGWIQEVHQMEDQGAYNQTELTKASLQLVKENLCFIFSAVNALARLLPPETKEEELKLEAYHMKIEWTHRKKHKQKDNFTKAVYRAHSLYPAESPIDEPLLMFRATTQKLSYTVFQITLKVRELIYKVEDPESWLKWMRKTKGEDLPEEDDGKPQAPVSKGKRMWPFLRPAI